MEDFAMLVHKLTEPAKRGDAATVDEPPPLLAEASPVENARRVVMRRSAVRF
jgi:hypothetical protein